MVSILPVIQRISASPRSKISAHQFLPLIDADLQFKSQIRAAVFSGLSDPQRKIRSSCVSTPLPKKPTPVDLWLQAFVISSVAHCDWPEEYPTLLTDLIGLLSLPSPPAVHGALQVFTEFISSDLTEDQILPVLRQLLPILLNILGSTEVRSRRPVNRANPTILSI